MNRKQVFNISPNRVFYNKGMNNESKSSQLLELITPTPVNLQHKITPTIVA